MPIPPLALLAGALVAAPVPLAPPPPPAVGWVAAASGAAMTLTLDAASTLPATGLVGTPVRIQLSCDENKPAAAYVMGKGYVPGMVRFDREVAVPADAAQRTKFGGLFRLTTDRKVVNPGHYYVRRPEDFIGTLLRHRWLLVRASAYLLPAVESTFDLAGLEPHLAAFEAACGLARPLPRPASGSEAAAVPDAPPPPAAPAAPEVERFENWAVTRPVSRMDDRPVVLLSLVPQTGATAANGMPALVFRCRTGVPEAFLSFDRTFFDPNYLAIQVSADGREAKEWWLSSSSAGRAFFFNSTGALLKRLLATRELRIVLGPRKPRKSDAWMPQGELAFAIAGLAEASKALLAECPMDLEKQKVKDALGPLP